MDLPSTKPYLIRAIHQWCCDNGFTPYLAVAVDARTRVPREHVRDGQIVVGEVMLLSLSFDHRIVDGREAVQFLVAMKETLEDPARLLLGI